MQIQIANGLSLATVALLLTLLAAPGDAKDHCNKEWMRHMMINSCSMDKRHAPHTGWQAVGRPRMYQYVMQQQLEKLVAEVMEEMDRMLLGDKVPMTTSPPPASPRPPHHSGDKHGAPQVIWSKLQDHPVEILGLTDDWLGLRESDDHYHTNPRRRNIQNLISSCCSDECNPEDFEGVC